MISFDSKARLAILVVLAGALGFGCGGASIEGLCEVVCECEGCDAKACVTEQETVRKKAETNQCVDKYDAFATCASDNLSCKSGEANYDNCDKEQFEVMLCVGQAK